MLIRINLKSKINIPDYKINMMIKDLINAAKSEDWEAIDEAIPKICDSEEYLLWAYETGIKDKNKDVRDLAVSILEKSHMPATRFKPMAPEILKLMKSDSNPYVRFRSAFALVAHNEATEAVKNTLMEAQKDPDVAKIAEEYLGRL
jgi:HEAT repeat protein